jgi:protein-S-isoprenylcysteine O-methyltransferase Ste14
MAGLVPWLITRWRPLTSPVAVVIGAVLVAVGIAVLVACFARFVTEGRGTPAPIAPTEELVVGGIYRYVRNPMYLAVTASILGQALMFGSWPLLAYAAFFMLITWTFVTLYEQPTLAERYGEPYAEYRRAVPGWWPRLTAWRPN